MCRNCNPAHTAATLPRGNRPHTTEHGASRPARRSSGPKNSPQTQMDPNVCTDNRTSGSCSFSCRGSLSFRAVPVPCRRPTECPPRPAFYAVSAVCFSGHFTVRCHCARLRSRGTAADITAAEHQKSLPFHREALICPAKRTMHPKECGSGPCCSANRKLCINSILSYIFSLAPPRAPFFGR